MYTCLFSFRDLTQQIQINDLYTVYGYSVNKILPKACDFFFIDGKTPCIYRVFKNDKLYSFLVTL